MRVLIADDDVFFRKLLHDFLKSEFEISLAENGLAAWETIQGTPGPMIAILDWVMPGMSGPEICRQVRSSRVGDDKYLMLLTSRNSSADVVAGLRAGADDYITKPFQTEELRSRIHLARRIVELQTSLEIHREIIQEADLDHLLAARGDAQEFLKDVVGRMGKLPYIEMTT